MGAIITCPLEVVKTRLQSSNSGFTPTPRTSISESSVSSKKPSSASGTYFWEKKSQTVIVFTENYNLLYSFFLNIEFYCRYYDQNGSHTRLGNIGS